MNWLTDYFAQRTPELCLSLAAWPPLRLGPEGPVPQSLRCLPYPGATLVLPARGTDFPRRTDHRIAGMLRDAQPHGFAGDRVGTQCGWRRFLRIGEDLCAVVLQPRLPRHDQRLALVCSGVFGR